MLLSVLSPVIGHDSNSVQLWGVSSLYCMLHVANLPRGSKQLTQLFVEQCSFAGLVGTRVCMFGGSFGPLPCFHVNGIWIYSVPDQFEQITVFQTCACEAVALTRGICPQSAVAQLCAGRALSLGSQL